MNYSNCLRIKIHSYAPFTRHYNAILSLIFLVGSQLTGLISSGQPPLLLKHYSTEDGLSQGTVYSMFQDSRGFMWFGTWDGLNRFDSYSFTSFKPRNNDSNSIAGTYINSIVEDKGGNIWVGTNDALNMYDHKKQIFKRHYLNEGGKRKHTGYKIFYIDDEGKLWINCNKQFICIFDINRQEFEILDYTRGLLQYNEITDQNRNYFKRVSKIYLAGSNGLNIIDVIKRSIDNRFTTQGPAGKVTDANLKAVYVDTGNTLWIASFKGIISLNERTNDYVIVDKDENGSPISGLVSIVPYDSTHFWVGSFGSGIFLFDKLQKKIVRTIIKSNLVQHGLTENIVDEIYQDRDGNHWLSAQPTGINMFNPGLIQFQSIYLNNDMRRGAGTNSAQGITSAGDHNILVAFYQSGILKYDLITGKQKIITLPKLDEEISVQTCFTDARGNIWAGSDYGLFFSGDAGEHFTRATPLKAYDFYDMFAFCATSTGDFFTGNSDGLFHVQYKDNKPVLPVQPIIKDTIINIVRLTGDEYVYANAANELVHFLWKDGAVQTIKKLKLSATAKHLEVQDAEWIWISTSSGIIIKNVITGKEERIDQSNGLSNQFVYAVLKGNDGYMWASTNDGINRISITDHSIIHFSLSSGLQGKEFNTGSYFKNSNGMLFFGGTNGANFFDPVKIQIPGFSAPMQLMMTAVNGVQTQADSFMMKEPYVLSFNEKNLSFSFTAIDFNRSDNIVYSYRINGQNWINIGNERTLRLLNLSSGDYEINIKAGLRSGMESPHSLTIRFRILPPWYRTTIAFIIFTAFLALLLYFLVKAFVRNKIKQQQSLLDKQQAVLKERERIIADLHDDVGSGLSTIRMMSDLMNSEQVAKNNHAAFATKISATAKDIAQRMNTIIWSLNAENDTIANFTEYVRQFGVSFFEDSPIRFHFSTGPFLQDDMQLNGIQRKNLFLITKEAFHNALKHSGATDVFAKIEMEDHAMQITILDNGGGISTGNQFGNGLKNMHKRMEEINGTIKIDPSNGTLIQLSVPYPGQAG